MSVEPWEFVGQPNVNDLGSRLLTELANPQWTELSAAIAFVKMSGVSHLARPLFAFASRGAVAMTVGIDQQGSSLEGIQTLWLVLGGTASRFYVLHNPGGSPSPTFHPKLWLFEGGGEALLLCGSGNLTGGGLYTNYEAGVALRMQSSDPALSSVRSVLAEWQDSARPEVVQVDAAGLQAMHDSGELPSEAATRLSTRLVRSARALVSGAGRGSRATSGLFGPSTVRQAPGASPLPNLPSAPVTPNPVPHVMGSRTAASSRASSTRRSPRARANQMSAPAQQSISAGQLVPQHDRLLMVVNPRNKTEIYLAQAPLKDDPGFFGAPFLGLTAPRRNNPSQPQPDPLPTANVTAYDVAGQVAGQAFDPSLKLWTYSFGRSANDDFRMTLTGGLHKLVSDGSILVMDRQPEGGADYSIGIFPPGHPQFQLLLAACTETLPGGRRYGWQ